MQKNKVITRRGTKVLKANRRPTRTETINKISEFASDVVIENKNELLEQDMTDDQLDNYIKNLIMLKLSGHDSVKKETHLIYAQWVNSWHSGLILVSVGYSQSQVLVG